MLVEVESKLLLDLSFEFVSVLICFQMDDLSVFTRFQYDGWSR